MLNGQYLYASFTDSSTIGTFAIEPGCGLMFVNYTQVNGLRGGIVNAMAIHGDMLITTSTGPSRRAMKCDDVMHLPIGMLPTHPPHCEDAGGAA